ncbi:unnamed protein product [Strongylus vulgaris]|uniref:Uncharacterized protein n=1 Tax=Strongylus vulgaris TaxID=40348 RepID=A0A3P7LBF7_STRVU|nr:unnamed protein product [Strongylus vulgaris]
MDGGLLGYFGAIEQNRIQHQAEVEQSIETITSSDLGISKVDSGAADGQNTIDQLRNQIIVLNEEKERIENEKMQIEDQLKKKNNRLKEALWIMNGMHDEISTFTPECLDRCEENSKGEGSTSTVQFHHVISLVQSYCRQFEQLELRLAVDNERQLLHVEEADLSETISDLQYRLFAADQRQTAYEKERVEYERSLKRLKDSEMLAITELFAADQRQTAYEKERAEYERCIKRLKDSEMLAISEISDLKDQISRILEREAKGNEQIKSMHSTIVELKAQLLSKSSQLNQLTEALEDSLSANVHHAEMLANVKNNFIEKVENARFKEWMKSFISVFKMIKSRECNDLRLEVLKKEREVKELKLELAQLKVVCDINRQAHSSQTSACDIEVKSYQV